MAGFRTGLLEGALMPAALPGLLGGKDLPIFAPNNVGRGYKIGYILGLNTCGTFFYGVAFWQPGGGGEPLRGPPDLVDCKLRIAVNF